MDINESGNVVNSGGYEILFNGNAVSATDIIVNNGNYNTGLIAFTVEEVEYQAYNGMTWEEFVYGEYNTSGIYVVDNQVYLNGDRLGCIGSDGYSTLVYPSDIIYHNYEYIRTVE